MVHEKIGGLKGDAEIGLSCGCVACPEKVVQRHERKFARPAVAAPVHVQIICRGAYMRERIFVTKTKIATTRPASPLFISHTGQPSLLPSHPAMRTRVSILF